MAPIAPALMALLAAASLATEAAAQLPWARPPGCNPSTCAGCTEFRISTDNFTMDSSGSTQVPENPCGGDGAYFPVPYEFFANCAEWYPYAWRCVPCCAAGCAPGACQWRGDGEFNTTHGCSACPAGATDQLLDVPAHTCRSCFRSRKCGEEQATLYRHCAERAPGQSVGEPPVHSPPSLQPAQPPQEAAPRDLPSPPPQPSPPPPAAEPPAAEPALEAPAPAPAAEAPAPEPEAVAPAAAAAPAPAPATPSGIDVISTVEAVPSLAAAPPVAAPPSAGAAPAACLAALILCAALAAMPF